MPDDLLEPYRSPADGPWDRVQAAHVLRRGGFQPNETEIREAIDAGPADTVERMVDDAPESRRHRDLDPLGESIVLRNDVHDLAAWWIGRMVHTANPLAARMAESLLERGIYVIGFSFPVVPQGQARIRTQISAAHTSDDLTYAVKMFAEVKTVLKI